jgi:hypothetical protein
MLREAVLTRYYFNLYNDEILRDETGEELNGPEAARRAAARSVSEVIAEQIVRGNTIDLNHRVEVQDYDGRIIATVRFGDFFYDSSEGNAA